MKSTRLTRALLTLGVLLAAAPSALAQTDTPTSTPTATATATGTVTQTPTRAPVCTTDFCAYHYGSFKADATGTGFDSFTRTIPGIKPGDLIVLYPTLSGCTTSAIIVTNNVIEAQVGCDANVAEQDIEYVWFSRTQDRCQGEDNCRRAFTVTPTP